MGVYIKGMEMPTSCRACLYSRTDIRNVDWCVLTEKDLPCDCPLVPVPSHGDLIDRKPFVEFIKTHWDSYDQWFVDQLEARPTVITADTAEEGE